MDKSNVNDTEKWLPQAENASSTPDSMGPATAQAHTTATQTTDERYMRRCLQLARCGLLGAKPNPMVGAVVVHNDRIIGEGYHIHCGEGHAEVNAFAAIRPEDEPFLPHSTLYVSLEPCSHYGKTPPCAGACGGGMCRPLFQSAGARHRKATSSRYRSGCGGARKRVFGT